MIYLLIFAFNVSTVEPVILKNCMSYKSVEEAKVHKTIDDLKKAGAKCEQADDEITQSWTCMDDKVVTKILFLKDKNECKEFPKKATDDIKKLMGKK